MEDPCKILNILPNASLVEIKSARRKLYKIWHPDKNPNNKKLAGQKCIEIAIAYEILTDQNSKFNYDTFRKWENKSNKNDFTESQRQEYQNAKNKYTESETEAKERVRKWFYDRIDILPQHRKSIYNINNDNTKLDNLINKINTRIGDKIWEFRIKYDTEFSDNVIKYEIRLVLIPSKTGFRESHLGWVENYYYGLFKKGTTEDYEHNKRIVDSWIKDILDDESEYYKMKIFFGIVGGIDAPWRCYLTLNVDLQISAVDIFHMLNTTRLTKFGKKFKNNIGLIFNDIAYDYKLSPHVIHHNPELRKVLVRLSENVYRISKGEKLVSEVKDKQLMLLYNEIKKSYPNAKANYSSIKLGCYKIDIYIPSKRIAIQYLNQYYYVTSDDDEFNVLKKAYMLRHKKIKEICKINNYILIEWNYKWEISKKLITILNLSNC